jgi:hypothetical protein
MRTSRLLLAGAGLAAAAVTGSAFTASNTVGPSSAGYGEGSVSGMTVSDIDYVPVTADATKLDSVVFTTTQDITGKQAKMTLKKASSQVGSPIACVVDSTFSTQMAVTCDISPDVLFTAFDTVGLTVYDND